MNDKNDRVLYVGSGGTPIKFKCNLLGYPEDIWPDGTVSRKEGERLIKLWLEHGFDNKKLVSINSVIGTESIQPPVKQAESSNNMKMNISREKLITAIQASIDAKQTQFEADSAKHQTLLDEITTAAKNFGLADDNRLKADVSSAMIAFGSIQPIIPSAIAVAKNQLAKLNLSTDENIELDAADAFLNYIQ